MRFTTVDPIRDGANWFAYVNNDPVNYIDLWGLLASEPERSKNIFSGFVDTVKGLFKDDDSKQIFTYGLSGSATGIGISGAVGAAVVGAAAGVVVSSWVDNRLEAVEKWIFSSQE